MNTDPQAADDAVTERRRDTAPAEKHPPENILNCDAYATAMPATEFSTTGVRAILARRKRAGLLLGSFARHLSESQPLND